MIIYFDFGPQMILGLKVKILVLIFKLDSGFDYSPVLSTFFRDGSENGKSLLNTCERMKRIVMSSF